MIYKKEQNYLSYTITTFIIIMMWILFSGNTGSADYSVYLREYNLIGMYSHTTNFEIGYELLCKIGNILGLEYNSFLIIYFAIGISLIISTIIKFTNNFKFVICLYFLYPFLSDVVQVRNFMSMSIIIFSIRYLVSDKKYDIYKYILGVLISMTFHTLSYIYILFILVKIEDKNKILKSILFISFILLLINPLLANILSMLFPKKQILQYMNGSTNIYFIIGYIVYMLGHFVLVNYSYNQVNKLKYNDNYDINKNEYDKYIKFAEVILKINIILIISIVPISINANFLRIYRNILILNYILYSLVAIKGKYLNIKGVMLNRIIVIYFVLIMSWVFLYNHKYFYAIVYPVVVENMIFRIFN